MLLDRPIQYESLEQRCNTVVAKIEEKTRNLSSTNQMTRICVCVCGIDIISSKKYRPNVNTRGQIWDFTIPKIMVFCFDCIDILDVITSSRLFCINYYFYIIMRYSQTHKAGQPLHGEGYTLTDLGHRPRSTVTRGTLPPTSGAETGLPLSMSVRM